MKITKSEFGTTKNGSTINLFHLENTSGAYQKSGMEKQGK